MWAERAEKQAGAVQMNVPVEREDPTERARGPPSSSGEE